MVENEFKLDPKKRFSSRVENYIKYRPDYPQEIISFLKKINILSSDSVIADIGSGTGILSKLFLNNGNLVYGIEPNLDMRSAGELILKKYSNFVSINGSAESTGLEPNTIDIITVGQAFHWFDLKKTRIEFLRILKPRGHIILIWNRRKKPENEFLKDYEKLLIKYGTEYTAIEKRKLDFDNLFGESLLSKGYEKKIFYNHQIFNYEGLKGRLLSTSYIPLKDSPVFFEIIEELKLLFDRYQENEMIRFEYDTEVYFGQLF